jgi:hypothetical protein
LNPTGRFCVFEVPLPIDGNADSCGTSAVFQTVTLFYADCKIFPSTSFVFDQIKSVFCYGEWYLAAILSLLPFSRNFVEFMLKSGVFGEKTFMFCH